MATWRSCAKCDVRLDRDAHNPRKTFTMPVAEPHCDSPTCNWCMRCHRLKLAECGLKPRTR